MAVVSVALQLLNQEIAYLLMWGEKTNKQTNYKYIFNQILNEFCFEKKWNQALNKQTKTPTLSHINK